MEIMEIRKIDREREDSRNERYTARINAQTRGWIAWFLNDEGRRERNTLIYND